MNEGLKDLYKIPESVLPQDIYLLDLSEQCAVMEERARKIAAQLPDGEREVLEAYFSLRDELEFQSVKQALRFSARSAQKNDRSF